VRESQLHYDRFPLEGRVWGPGREKGVLENTTKKVGGPWEKRKKGELRVERKTGGNHRVGRLNAGRPMRITHIGDGGRLGNRGCLPVAEVKEVWGGLQENVEIRFLKGSQVRETE